MVASEENFMLGSRTAEVSDGGNGLDGLMLRVDGIGGNFPPLCEQAWYPLVAQASCGVAKSQCP